MKKLTIYIAASWKHQHAVEMLTAMLREKGHKVLSFVENEHFEKGMPFEEWVGSEHGYKSFKYDTDGATKSDLVLYIGPSGKDAAAEIGAAWQAGVPVIGLYGKGEDFGLMRRMIEWQKDYREMLATVDMYAGVVKGPITAFACNPDESDLPGIIRR